MRIDLLSVLGFFGVLVAILRVARADPRFAALAPGPIGDVEVYGDASVTSGGGQAKPTLQPVSGRLEILDLGADVAIVKIDKTELRLFGDIPLVSGSIDDNDEGGDAHGIGNPTLGIALSGRALGGAGRVEIAAAPLLSHLSLEPVDGFAESTTSSHALAQWLARELSGRGVAANGAARLMIERNRRFLTVEPGLGGVSGPTSRLIAAEVTAAVGLQLDSVTLFSEGAVVHRWKFAPDYDDRDAPWEASLALAARFGRGGWAVTPWIAIPLVGEPDNWFWVTVGLSLDYAR